MFFVLPSEKSTAKKTKKTTLLTDASDDFKTDCIPILNKAKEGATYLYIGMHMQLNERVATDQYKEIKTVAYDLRGHVLGNPIRFVDSLSEVQQMEHINRMSTTLDKENIILSSLSEVSVREYVEKLDAFTKQLGATPACITQAKAFFSSRSRGNDITLTKHILLEEYDKTRSDERFMHDNQWMFQLNNLIATVALTNALTEALHSDNSIIVYAGQHYAITANEQLKQAGYSSVVSEGLQQRASQAQEQFLSPDCLEEFLAKFMSNKNYCICSKPTKLRCSHCKLAYYCSKECQATDWHSHQLTCKKP